MERFLHLWFVLHGAQYYALQIKQENSGTLSGPPWDWRNTKGKISLYLSHSPRLAGLIGAKGNGSGAIRRAKLQTNRHHQQTNTHPFTSPTNSVIN